MSGFGVALTTVAMVVTPAAMGSCLAGLLMLNKSSATLAFIDPACGEIHARTIATVNERGRMAWVP